MYNLSKSIVNSRCFFTRIILVLCIFNATNSAYADNTDFALRINVGGEEYTDSTGHLWQADTGFNTGNLSSSAIGSQITGTDDLVLYQSARWDAGAAPELHYSFNVPDGEYTVRLHFADSYIVTQGEGLRVFDVALEDQLALENLDIFSEVGGNAALVKTLTTQVNDGTLDIEFLHQVENPAIRAIEITETPSFVRRINVGGDEYTDSLGQLWVADKGFNTGRLSSSGIGAQISGTDDPALYQSGRWDAGSAPELAYRFEVPDGSYAVHLHFADTFSGTQGAGLRVFDVLLEEQPALTGLDVFAEAGASTALIKKLEVEVSDGALDIGFLHQVQNPEIRAIEIESISRIVPQRPVPDLVVSLKGLDNDSCGGVQTPCRTVEYTVENRAQAGELVGIVPGIYDETASIEVPAQVSITGMGTDASDVVLRPDYAVNSRRDFFINLVDSELDQDGDQSVSYLTLEAHAASNVGWRAIQVKNRNNVRIHHNRILNWDLKNRAPWDSAAVLVRSSEKFKYHPAEWWKYLPDDLGSPGDYSSWVDWPKHPVTNFTFDHNYVFRSGPVQEYIKGVSEGRERPGAATNFINLRDSAIHDNEFDVRGVYAKAISGTSSFWDNVDVYRNILRATDAHSEGWIPPTAKSRSTYVLETWMHINGCEWYDNVTNDAFSLAFNKETVIRNNILLGTKRRGIAIETGMLSHSAVHHNYIFGGRGGGIVHRYTRPMQLSGGSVYQNIVIDGGGFGISIQADSGFCRTGASGLVDMAIYNNLIDGTRWGGIRVRGNCDSVTAPLEVSMANNIFTRSGSGWSGINLEMSSNFDTLALNLDNNIMFDNENGNGILCKVLGVGRCLATDRGAVESGSIKAAPRFAGVIDTITGSPDVVFVDDASAFGTARQGTWRSASSSDIRAYPNDGDASVHVAGGGDWFEFQASDLSTDRPTAVALRWPRNFSARRSSAVPVSVYDGDNPVAIASFTIDQAGWDSSGWYYLDRLVFPSGRARLRIHSVDDGSVVADAVLWAKLGYGYRTDALSPAIDAGSAEVESIVKTDFTGRPVPQGNAPDIGIYEQ